MAMIHEAICATMNDVGAVSKGDFNQYDKYKFRGIDAVMNALNPAMRKNGIFVVPTVLKHHQEERQSQKGGLMIYTTCEVRYTFYAKDGSSVDAVVVGEAMDRSDKSTNKAMSAAFKYACFQTFCIPTEEMVDSETESPTVEPRNSAKEETIDRTGEPAYPPIEKMVMEVEDYVLKHPNVASFIDQSKQQVKASNLNELAAKKPAFIQAVWNKWCNK